MRTSYLGCGIKVLLMDKLNIFLLLIALLFAGSCQHSTPQEESLPSGTEGITPDETGPAYTSAYVCPMHCAGSGSGKPGVCPVCGMDYVVNKPSQSLEEVQRNRAKEGTDTSKDSIGG